METIFHIDINFQINTIYNIHFTKCNNNADKTDELSIVSREIFKID